MTNYKIVYKATNRHNGKHYIGLSKNTIETRRSEHFKSAIYGSQQHFHRAIRKHGEAAFEWCVLCECSSGNLTSVIEQKMIVHYDSYKKGYNMTTGGESNWSKVTSKETKKKLSDLYKGKTYEEIHGAEKAANIKSKQSRSHTGKIVSNGTRRRMSAANKRRWQEGTIGRIGKPCEVFGYQYKNGKTAASELRISGVTLRKWIKQSKNGAKYI